MTATTQQLAHFAVNSKPSDVPEAVIHEAKRTVLNWLGCSIAGSRTESVDCALAAVNDLSGPRLATVLGRSERLDISNAAFVNGVSADVLSFSDTHPATLMHPGGVVGCAALALAERGKVSGKDFLHALIIGYDIGCRIGLSVYPWHYNRGWHITGTAGIFGSTAASGRLLGLNERQMVWAMGIAATQAAGLREMFGSMCKNLHIGRAAQNGLLAALLAQKNFTSSEQSLEAPRGYMRVLGENPNLEIVTSDLGTRYEIATNTYKPYPCGVVIHPIIEGCITLATQHNIDPAAVRKIVLRCCPLVLELCGKKTPKNTLEAKLSVFYSAAVAVVARRVAEREYGDEFLGNAAVIRLRDSVTVETDAAIREDETHVTLEMSDGQRVQCHIDHVTGSVDRPMSDHDMVQKFHGLVEPILPKARIEQLVDACWNITQLDDVSTLARLASTASIATAA